MLTPESLPVLERSLLGRLLVVTPLLLLTAKPRLKVAQLPLLAARHLRQRMPGVRLLLLAALATRLERAGQLGLRAVLVERPALAAM